ncbi:MAG TPA: DUF3343 domain-containing protein [Symbiobacteriaceae bacterium]|jgi:hypothetical protein
MHELDGVITFFSSHHAVRAERVLQLHNIPNRTVPCPRELSSSCGVALRFPHEGRTRVAELLAIANVQFESIHHHPEAQSLPPGWTSLLQRLKRPERKGEGS